MSVDRRKRSGVRLPLWVLALVVAAVGMSSCVIPIPVTHSISWLDSVDLDNNSDAEDPTWNGLVKFLAYDKTDERIYSGDFICADFAVTLHDNAEEAGIRAAVVAVDFEDDDIGHALNAFETTDRGLVYVDCTGDLIRGYTLEELLATGGETPGCDRVAYIEVGKKYGTVSLDVAEPTSYKFYEEYMQKWEDYDDMAEEYDSLYAACGGVASLGECSKLFPMHNNLQTQLEDLGFWKWESLGTVADIEIMW